MAVTPKVDLNRQSGLIFVQSVDPLSQCVQNLTRETYTAYGFYVPTRASGSVRPLVYLYDRVGCEPVWSPWETDLPTLQQHPLVKRLTIRPVRSNADVAFRTAVREILRSLSTTGPPLKDCLAEFIRTLPTSRCKDEYSPLQQKALSWLQLSMGVATKSADTKKLDDFLEAPIELPLEPADNLQSFITKCRPGSIQRMASVIDLLLNQPDLTSWVPTKPISKPDTTADQLYDLVVDVVGQIKRGIPPSIDINKLIHLANQGSPDRPQLPLLPGEASYPATLAVTAQTTSELKISSLNGIVVPSEGAKLDHLTLKQLRAIAVELDEAADRRFDKLRTQVASRLAELVPAR